MRTVTKEQRFNKIFDYLLEICPDQKLLIKGLKEITLFKNRDELKDKV